MSAGSARDRQFGGRRQNDEAEPFLVQEIPGSPVMRGRRQNSEEERFLVEEIPGSPVVRGRVPRVVPATRISPDESTGPLSDTSIQDSGFNSTIDTMDGPNRITPTAPMSTPTDNYPTTSNRPRAPDNDDAPPSYESSIPPSQLGWATEVTTKIPFPMPYFSDQPDGRPPKTFSYPPSTAYPPIGLSPFAQSYQSIESSRSKSQIRSTSPSPSPSIDRFRPAYTYQHASLVRSSPPRPQYRMNYDNDHYVSKPQNTFSYKYGGTLIAVSFVAFLMVLSLVVKLLIHSKKS